MKDEVIIIEEGKEVRCYDCGYRGKEYVINYVFSLDEGGSRMCPHCHGWSFEIVPETDPYSAVEGWKRMRDRK